MFNYIHCLPPIELSDLVLRREYYRIYDWYTKLDKAVKNTSGLLGNSRKPIPDEYSCIHRNSVFFYDKLNYVTHRHMQLAREILHRGIFTPVLSGLSQHIHLKSKNYPKWVFNGWVPSKSDIQLDRTITLDYMSQQSYAHEWSDRPPPEYATWTWARTIVPYSFKVDSANIQRK